MVGIPLLLDIHTKGKFQFGCNVGLLSVLNTNYTLIYVDKEKDNRIVIEQQRYKPHSFSMGPILNAGVRVYVLPKLLLSLEAQTMALFDVGYYSKSFGRDIERPFIISNLNLGIAYSLPVNKKTAK